MKSQDIRWHDHSVTREERATQKKQKPALVWFTGLSGAGKSTLANALDRALFDLGHHTFLLDGDNVRHGLCKDLGFTDEDRTENIRRIGEVAKLMVDSGLIVMSAFISPFRSDRDMVRAMFKEGEFIEVYVSTPLETCERRDPKGLYQKVRAGQLRQFTGIDSPYEPPVSPEMQIDTSTEAIVVSLERLLILLRRL